MKNTWPLQEAKNQFSQVVENALKRGHQTITQRGKPAVVVMSVKDFNRMRNKKKSIVELFAPLRGVELNLTRDKSLLREIIL